MKLETFLQTVSVGSHVVKGECEFFLFCYEESRVLMKIELIQTVFF